MNGWTPGYRGERQESGFITGVCGRETKLCLHADHSSFHFEQRPAAAQQIPLGERSEGGSKQAHRM